MYKPCELIDDCNCTEVPELLSDQEEADTKVCLHALNALKINPNKYMIIRSHSGNVDINVVLVSLITCCADKVFADVNTGKNRKVLRLLDVKLSTYEKEALVGFHVFTGNDYVSSFFGKGKQKCWKVLKNDSRYINAFKSLGLTSDLNAETFKMLESYVRRLYGRKGGERVNSACYKIFKEIYEKKNIILDLSLLLPCQEALRLHCKCSCFVVALWKFSIQKQIIAPSPVRYGWEADMSVKWIIEAFPEDIELVLMETKEDPEDIEDVYEGCDSESDLDLE